MVASLNVVSGLLAEATTGTAQLEGPQEVVGLLEARAHSKDLVDEVLHADDAVLAQTLCLWGKNKEVSGTHYHHQFPFLHKYDILHHNEAGLKRSEFGIQI